MARTVMQLTTQEAAARLDMDVRSYRRYANLYNMTPTSTNGGVNGRQKTWDLVTVNALAKQIKQQKARLKADRAEKAVRRAEEATI